MRNGWGMAAGSLVAALLLSVLLTGSSSAAGSSVPVPEGFRLMCLDHPAECRGGGASTIPYTADLMGLIQRTNQKVNAAIVSRPDQLMDVWTINAKIGDCEEYVLAKRDALIASGIPASSLSIVYALRNGGGHAILAVNTDNGSFVLDNKTAAIKRLAETGYKLISMSGPNPLIWHRA
jgi:predicted transglutaminase-like cysteine proteinase